MSTRTHGPSALLASPVFAGSIALLVLNDHVLKQAWPGLVTGKLSDLSGVVMIAVVLTVLLRRPGLGCVATAAAFAALKTVPAAAIWSAPALGGVTRTDPSDLVVLIALVPMWMWMARRPLRSLVPAGDVRWVLPLQILALSAATFATTATSCATTSTGAIEARDGVFVVAHEQRVFGSADGGVTWAAIDRPPPIARATEVCLDDGTCFTVVGDSVMERSASGVTSTVFAYTSDELSAQERNADVICDVDPHDGFVAIAAGELSDGSHVVVTMGSQGVLVRTPDGRWSGHAVDGFGPISTDTFDLGGVTGRVLLLIPLVVLGVAFVLPFGFSGRRKRWAPAVLIGLACGVLYAVMFLMAFGRAGALMDRAIARWGLVAAVTGILLLSIEYWWLRRPDERSFPPPSADRRVG